MLETDRGSGKPAVFKHLPGPALRTTWNGCHPQVPNGLFATEPRPRLFCDHSSLSMSGALVVFDNPENNGNGTTG